MPSYTDRVFAALGPFTGHLSALVQQVQALPPDTPRLPRRTLDDLLEIAARVRNASDAITRSFTLIEQTSLDVVDMQVRLQGETARLASSLRALGERVQDQHVVLAALGDELVALDEAAQLVAAAVFPSAVQGLRDVNVALWAFEKLQWKRYTDLLTEVVRRETITTEQQVRIQDIADGVAGAFAAVNRLLNELAESRPSDAAGLRARLEHAPTRLTDALGVARARMSEAGKPFGAFAPVIDDSADVAEDVAKRLRKLRIPVFPAHGSLGPCREMVSPALYDGLSGVQTFALLNILARLQATQTASQPLLSGRDARVTHAFPDRIYLEAHRSLIDDLARDRAFVTAPASLHRFKEGSFKQRTFSKGNLQVSYATRAANRVVIDADLDLYRSPLRHLFGEVLVNHLTGDTTDQYAVRRILDEQSVGPIGSFELLRV